MIRVDPYTSDYAVSHRITNWNHIPHSFSPCELSHYIFFILNAPSTLFNLAFHNFPLNKKTKETKKRFRIFFCSFFHPSSCGNLCMREIFFSHHQFASIYPLSSLSFNNHFIYSITYPLLIQISVPTNPREM